jgi:hypothetical protein
MTRRGDSLPFTTVAGFIPADTGDGRRDQSMFDLSMLLRWSLGLAAALASPSATATDMGGARLAMASRTFRGIAAAADTSAT